MKKVLILSLAYFPHVGGAEIAVKKITDRMPEIEWHMVTKRMGDEPASERIGNILVNRIGNRGVGKVSKFFFQFSAAFKAHELHSKHTYDAVWSIMAHSAGVPGALFKFFHPNVPLILTLQEGDPIEHIERTLLPLWPLFARTFTAADVVQPISNFLGGWARRRGFWGPLEIIPNGVDIKKFEGAPIAHEGLVFITTSRLVHKNGIDTIIRAMPSLPDAKLQIIGSGVEEANLKKLIQELGVESRVEFLGYVPQEKIPAYLHAADIFIRPSRSEGMGNSFIEAMAAGVPVIATQEGGIADFLFDAKKNPDQEPTGWAVDTDAPGQIVQAVEDILGDKTQTLRVIEHARAMVRQKYDWGYISEAMRERVFNKVLK